MIIADLMKREYIAKGLNLRVKPHKDIGVQNEEYSLCLQYKIEDGLVRKMEDSEIARLLKRNNLNVTFKVMSTGDSMESVYLTEEEKLSLGLTVYTPYEVDRGLYMKSVCEILNYDYDSMVNKFPSTINRNEAYFWTCYEEDYQEPYKALYPLYENIFKSEIIRILRESYIVIPDEKDEETGDIIPGEDFDLDKTRRGIVDKLSGYTNTIDYLKDNPNVTRYELARDLSVYVIYYTNVIDVFGRVFLDYLPGIDMGYKGESHPHPTYLQYTLKIDEETLKMVMANLNSPEIFILNLGEFDLLSTKDQTLVEFESYVDEIENTIKNEVKILESNHLSESIVEGFINSVLVENSKLFDSNKKFKTAGILPLKLAFTTLKGNRELSIEYFNNVRQIIKHKDYALSIGKVTTIRFVILKTLLEWWDNYSNKTYNSRSIQLTLTALANTEHKLQEYGYLKMSYYMLTPSKMKLVIFNSYGRGEEGVQLMETAQNLLYREFGNSLDVSEEVSKSNQYNSNNNLMRSFTIRVHI